MADMEKVATEVEDTVGVEEEVDQDMGPLRLLMVPLDHHLVVQILVMAPQLVRDYQKMQTLCAMFTIIICWSIRFNTLSNFLFYTIPVSPVNCQWTVWAQWGACSLTCGGGTQTKTRSIKVQAAHGGNTCTGGASTSQKCNTDACPGNVSCFEP